MEIVLIRHTRTAAPAGVCYGRLDVPLHPDSAGDIATTLTTIARVDQVFSSPSQRCAALASALAQRDACALTLTAALHELDFGEWEGASWDEVSRADSDPWADDPWNRAPPRGETEAALWRRVDVWRRQLLEKQHGRIAVVAHAGSLRALRCLLLNTPPEARWAWRIEYGASEVLIHQS